MKQKYWNQSEESNTLQKENANLNDLRLNNEGQKTVEKYF